MNRLATSRSLLFSAIVWSLLVASVSDWTNVADIFSTGTVTHAFEDVGDPLGLAACTTPPAPGVATHSFAASSADASARKATVGASMFDDDSPSLSGPSNSTGQSGDTRSTSSPLLLPTVLLADNLYLLHCALLI